MIILSKSLPYVDKFVDKWPVTHRFQTFELDQLPVYKLPAAFFIPRPLPFRG